MSQYAIVEFVGDESIEIIPTNWLVVGEKECCWPPYRVSQVGKEVQLRTAPDPSWKLEKIRVLGKAGMYSLNVG